jgi:hypothetical protein
MNLQIFADLPFKLFKMRFTSQLCFFSEKVGQGTQTTLDPQSKHLIPRLDSTQGNGGFRCWKTMEAYHKAMDA